MRLCSCVIMACRRIAGWSSLVARWAHNPKVVGSNPTPATIENKGLTENRRSFFFLCPKGQVYRKLYHTIFGHFRKKVQLAQLRNSIGL